MQYWKAYARFNMTLVGALYVSLIVFSTLARGSQEHTREPHRDIADRLRRFAEGLMVCRSNVGMSIALVKVSAHIVRVGHMCMGVGQHVRMLRNLVEQWN